MIETSSYLFDFVGLLVWTFDPLNDQNFYLIRLRVCNVDIEEQDNNCKISRKSY